MLTRRSTVAIVLLFAAGSIQAHAATTKAHALHKARAGHVAASVFSVPLLAQSPLNWGRAPAGAPEVPGLPAATAAPGIALAALAPSVVATVAADNVFSVPLLAQSPWNWGQDPAGASAAMPLQPSVLPLSKLTTAYRHASGFMASEDAGAGSALAARSLADDTADTVAGLRDALVDLAMSLRDIPYVSGGSTPSTGFDCSGFVRYVFARAIGMRLPANAASQFLAGLKVSRGRLKTGDLVFFHTSGKHRISHVGIYLSNGRFIHAPTSGKTVEVSSLNETYWSRRFAGARRPAAIVAAANNG
ncbi:MAG: C40 family peptidase [Xanthomonadales bacterium]|nr:C40 family peptidase [Xanthomonadales bacterium]